MSDHPGLPSARIPPYSRCFLLVNFHSLTLLLGYKAPLTHLHLGLNLISLPNCKPHCSGPCTHRSSPISSSLSYHLRQSLWTILSLTASTGKGQMTAWNEPEQVSVKLLSHVWLFVAPWTVAHQAPPSMGFSRQEHWSGLPFPSPGDLPNPGIEPGSPAL